VAQGERRGGRPIPPPPSLTGKGNGEGNGGGRDKPRPYGGAMSSVRALPPDHDGDGLDEDRESSQMDQLRM